MYRSQSFEKQLDRAKKRANASGESIYPQLESAFLQSIPAAPTSLGTELYAYLTGEIVESHRTETVLGDVIDLLWQDYDDRNDPLMAQDWDFLKDLVDEHALELPMDLVQYVMERVVSHGRL